MFGVIWLLLPRGFPARWLGLCLLLPALLWRAERPAAGEAWVDVLDVGQGLAVVVRTAEHSLLYDTGPLYSAESDAGQRIIVPYLRAHGVRRIDTLVVTHRDKDHSGGVLP
jgi:competence protein ComEC